MKLNELLAAYIKDREETGIKMDILALSEPFFERLLKEERLPLETENLDFLDAYVWRTEYNCHDFEEYLLDQLNKIPPVNGS